MTDKELDDLEARLQIVIDNPIVRSIGPVAKDAADAIAELRVKNAALDGALCELLLWVEPPHSGDWDTPRGNAIRLAETVLKENTQ